MDPRSKARRRSRGGSMISPSTRGHGARAMRGLEVAQWEPGVPGSVDTTPASPPGRSPPSLIGCHSAGKTFGVTLLLGSA